MWLERLERTGDALGASPAPLRVPVLDALTNAVDLADEMSAALMRPSTEPPSTALAAPRPYLEFVAHRLAEVNDAELATWAYQRARALVAAVARALGCVHGSGVRG